MRSRKARFWKPLGPRAAIPLNAGDGQAGVGPTERTAPAAFLVDGHIVQSPSRNAFGKTLLGLGAAQRASSEATHHAASGQPSAVRIQYVAQLSQPSAADAHAPAQAHAGTQPASLPPDGLVAKHDRPPAADTRASAVRGRPRWAYRAVGLASGLLAGGLAFLAYSRASAIEATDDAQVDAHIISVSSRVHGTVSAVHVHPHQVVHAGDLLAELDPLDFKLAVNAANAGLTRAEAALQADEPSVAITESGDMAAQTAAQAQLDSAQAALASSLSDVKRLQANLAEADAQARLAYNEQERSRYLRQTGALSQAALDATDRAVETTRANADAIRQHIAMTTAGITQRRADISAAQARLKEQSQNGPRRLESRRAALAATQASWELAKTQLEQAQAQLSYTKIYAPVSGVIGDKIASLGEATAPGQQLLAVCQNDEPWITANYRETQLQHMHTGQRASVYVDALDQTFEGHVESIAGATGSRFSLLPPENASGNYVKVVQRIPVKIRLEAGQPGLSELRVGMSVEPSVHVR